MPLFGEKLGSQARKRLLRRYVADVHVSLLDDLADGCRKASKPRVQRASSRSYFLLHVSSMYVERDALKLLLEDHLRHHVLTNTASFMFTAPATRYASRDN